MKALLIGCMFVLGLIGVAESQEGAPILVDRTDFQDCRIETTLKRDMLWDGSGREVMRPYNFLYCLPIKIEVLDSEGKKESHVSEKYRCCRYNEGPRITFALSLGEPVIKVDRLLDGVLPFVRGCAVPDYGVSVMCTSSLKFSGERKGKTYESFLRSEPDIFLAGGTSLIGGRDMSAIISKALKARHVVVTLGNSVTTFSLRGFNAAWRVLQRRHKAGSEWLESQTLN